MKLIKYKSWLLFLIIIFTIFLSLEILARAFFPEYKGSIHAKNLTYNVSIYQDKFENIEAVDSRIPFSGFRHEDLSEKPWIVVLGDSISGGFGSPYEDVYWVRLQRILNLIEAPSYRIINSSSLGKNSKDMLKTLKLFNAAAKNKSAQIATILYQFNFNDITPYNKASLKRLQKKNIKYHPLQRKFGSFRYEYLHRSVFFHFVASHARAFLHDRYGTCEERGVDALGQYTWTFGSKKFKEESEVLWEEFGETLRKGKELAGAFGADFSIFLSPTIFDVDLSGVHQRFNTLNLDFSCATIKPRERLKTLSKKLNIDLIDPAKYLRKSFELRIKENNFSPYFFLVDTNHFTPTASAYIAEIWRHIF